MIDNIKDDILKSDLVNYLFRGKWGLEKENLRVNSNGELSLTPHPDKLGDKLTHPYITTDFSESQVEIITQPEDSIDNVYYSLENIHDLVYENIGENEFLWPSSMPPVIPEDSKIPIADYGTSCEAILKMEYRDFIAKRYGKHKQLISGIHYNFSFSDEFLSSLYNYKKPDITLREFKDTIYLKVARNLLKNQWLMTYLLGANVAIHSSYKVNKGIEAFKSGDEYIFPNACSYRSSVYGYRNNENFRINFDNLDNTLSDLDKLIKEGSLNSVNEYYSPVRLKNSMDKNSTCQLKCKGIEYLELRMIDLNPLTKVGISRGDLYLIHLLILYSLLEEDSSYSVNDQEESLHKLNYISITGRKKFKKLESEFNSLSNRIEEVLSPFITGKKEYMDALLVIKERINNTDSIYSNSIYNSVKERGFINYHMEIARKNRVESISKKFSLKGYEDLELSTQILIKEALLKGFKVDILDRKENFILVSHNGKEEYIKQATKTSLDTYSTALVMENKAITKRVLEGKGVSVPKGGIYTDIKSAIDDFKLYLKSKIVIKPNNTNFGLGITILKENFSSDDFSAGLELAFSYDKTVLIEEFFPGNEYRFTVIDGEVSGILQRVPANVTGDGVSTIRELVDVKNMDPLRGEGYKTPLERIKLNEEEIFHLKNMGYTPDSVPGNGETIYLRENSNISTGGDSIDFTDDIPEGYKREAIRAAEAVGAKITGVDMIIKDIKENWTRENSTIIELNFNPAIHIHCYPYKGVNRRLGRKLLNSLGF